MKIRARDRARYEIAAVKTVRLVVALGVFFVCVSSRLGYAQDTLAPTRVNSQTSPTIGDTAPANKRSNPAGIRQREKAGNVPASSDTLNRNVAEVAEENKLIIARWQFWLGTITVVVSTLGTIIVAFMSNKRSADGGARSGNSGWPASTLLSIPILILAVYTFFVLPSRAAPMEGNVDRDMVLRLIHAEAADETQVQQWVYEEIRRQGFLSDSLITSVQGSVRQLESDLARHQNTLEDYTNEINLLANSLRESQGRFPTEHYLLTTTSNVQQEIIRMRLELEQIEKNIDRSRDVNPELATRKSNSLLLWQILAALNALAAGILLYYRRRKSPTLEAGSLTYP